MVSPIQTYALPTRSNGGKAVLVLESSPELGGAEVALNKVNI